MRDFGQVPGRIGLELLEEHPVGGDLAERLAVGRTRHRQRDRARRAVPRQTDHAHVVAEVLAAELRADPELLRERQHFGFELHVAEAAPELVAGGRAASRDSAPTRASRSSTPSPPTCRRSRARGGTADTQRCRACAASRRASVSNDDGLSSAFVSWNSRLLFAEPPPLAMNNSLYASPSTDSISISAGRFVPVFFSSYIGERRHLRVAQVVLGVGAEDAAGDRLAVAAARQHQLALLALHDRGAGVLARREDAARRDARVLQQLQRDEAIVRRRFGIVEDRRQLREVAGTQQVRDVEHRGAASAS